MKVCEVYSYEGKIFVDKKEFDTYDAAYRCIREKYNAALGKANYLKFGHIGNRTARISKPGIVLESSYREYLQSTYEHTKKVKWYLLGMIDTSYSKITGCYYFGDEYKDYDEMQVEEYLDWIFCRGSDMLCQYDRRPTKKITNTKIQNNGRKKQRRKV